MTSDFNQVLQHDEAMEKATEWAEVPTERNADSTTLWKDLGLPCRQVERLGVQKCLGDVACEAAMENERCTYGPHGYIATVPDHPASHTHVETDTWKQSIFPPGKQSDTFFLKQLNVPGKRTPGSGIRKAQGNGRWPSWSPPGRAFHQRSPTCDLRKGAIPMKGHLATENKITYAFVLWIASPFPRSYPNNVFAKLRKRQAHGNSLQLYMQQQKMGPKCHP